MLKIRVNISLSLFRNTHTVCAQSWLCNLHRIKSHRSSGRSWPTFFATVLHALCSLKFTREEDVLYLLYTGFHPLSCIDYQKGKSSKLELLTVCGDL